MSSIADEILSYFGISDREDDYLEHYGTPRHIMTVKTITGKTIQYDVKDAKAYAKYNPVEKRDPATGEVSYTSGDGTIDYRVKKRTQVSTKMAETDDAYTLVSKYRHTMELVYADYANEMKNLGNKARIEMVNTGKIPYSSTAKKFTMEMTVFWRQKYPKEEKTILAHGSTNIGGEIWKVS